MGQESRCSVRNILCVSCVVLIKKTLGAQPSLEVEVSQGKEDSLLLENNKEETYQSHNISDGQETSDYHNLDLQTIAEQILVKDDIFNYSQSLNRGNNHDHHGLDEHDHVEKNHGHQNHDNHKSNFDYNHPDNENPDHDHSKHASQRIPPAHQDSVSLATWLVSLSSIAFISLVGLATVAAVPLLQGR